jgi:hypothetical protein
VKGQDGGRVLFKESYDPQLVLNLATIPSVFVIVGIFALTFDPSFGAWLVLIGGLSGIAEYLLIPQRLVMTTTSFQPQLMRFKAIRMGVRVVPWSSVTAIWPLYWSNPASTETKLRGFEAAAPALGSAKLVPTRSLSGKAKVEHLESAVKAGLGPRLNEVWREIPDVSKDDVERMRKVLMTSSTKQSVSGLAKIYIPITAFIEIQAFYVMLNKRMLSADQLCLLGLVLMALTTILFIITFVALYRMWKRQRSFYEMLSLYFQVRRHEEKSGKRLLPQMQMLARYRKLDPKPPPVETYRGTELLRSLRYLNLKTYCWIGASFVVPFAVMPLVFTYHLSPVLLLLSLPFIPVAVILGASSMFEAQNVVADLRMIVHEEWKTGYEYLPKKTDLRIWGIQRNPVELMQKNLPRLRAIATKHERINVLVVITTAVILAAIIISVFILRGKAQTFVLIISLTMLVVPVGLLMRRKIAPEIRDPAVRAILEYEEVTGRQLLPPELASLREKRKAG